MSRLTIDIAPEVRASSTFGPLVERANEWLQASMPPTDEPVQAEWTAVDNRPGEEMVALTLKDNFSSPTRLFRKTTLQERSDAEHDFNRLIGSLLRTRSHFLLKRLHALSSSPED
jgi:hypothetical protein